MDERLAVGGRGDGRDADSEDRETEPPVVLPYLAYFFLALPDPLGLPHAWTLRINEASPGKWWRRSEWGVPPAVHTAGSLLFHRAEAPTAGRDQLSVLFEVAAAALPDPGRPERKPAPDLGESAVELTVVEMAVGFEPGTDPDPDDLDATEGPFFEELSGAFDRGLEWVREVQRAYYIARRLPLKLVTREALPFAVPLGVRRVYDDDGNVLPFRVPLSLYLLNNNSTTRDADLDASDERALRSALNERAGSGVFTAYLDFRREAGVALERDGAYRAAVLFTATACEVLLDDLLAHMLWQEGARPEEAAPLFGPYLTTRVKTQYHSRLGGSWSIEALGEVREWSAGVAALRNRVVHGGYEPALDEVRRAVDAADALQNFLADLLATRVSAYPRTALVLPGEHGLRRRGRWSRELEELLENPSEVLWTQTFARWRSAMQRARLDSPLASVPSATEAWVIAVVRPGGAVQWVVHDRAAGLAAAVDQSHVGGIQPGQHEGLDGLVARLVEESLDEAVSIHVAGAVVAEPAAGVWVPEYRLVPMAGVMVNGADLDPV